MESSFRQQYTKSSISGDGVLLVFRASRLGAWLIPAAGAIFCSTFLVSCDIASIGLASMGVKGSDSIFPVMFISLFMAVFLPYKLFRNRKQEVVLRPDGMVFRGKQLAIKDVSVFGIENQISSSNTVTVTAQIYAEALGQRIKITDNITEALAKSLLGEITSYYRR